MYLHERLICMVNVGQFTIHGNGKYHLTNFNLWSRRRFRKPQKNRSLQHVVSANASDGKAVSQADSDMCVS